MMPYTAHRCDFCSGTVQPTIARNESLRVLGGVVLLDGVEIGKCDRCGHTYFPADIVKRAERAARHPETASQIRSIPVIAA